MKKVLIITYYWPPGGGPGVQRWLKFVKYLPDFGVEPIVLTIDPKSATYPVMDESLLKDIAPGTKIYTTDGFNALKIAGKIFGKKNLAQSGFSGVNKKSLKQRLLRFVRGNMFVPDPRKGWNKNACKKAVEIIREFNINTVITSSPPHSTQLIGLKLKRKLGIKWISDLRDPWTDIYYYKDLSRTFLARRIDQGYENSVLKMADTHITVSKSLKELFESKGAVRVEVIPNGFDPDDFAKKDPINRFNTGQLNILYAGTISDAYKPKVLLDAFENMGELRNQFHLHFVGSLTDRLRTMVSQTMGDNCSFHNYVPHEEIFSYYNSADILLLVIPDTAHAAGILTGKLFEYLALRKPILGIGPKDGDAAGIVRICDAGEFFERDDEALIANFLIGVLKATSRYSYRHVDRYSRVNLTGDLVRILSEDTNPIKPE